MRVLFLISLLVVFTTGVAGLHRWQAQIAPPAEDLCADRYDSRRAHHCEVREEIIATVSALDIDPGPNGGVRIRGWDRSDARLRTRVEASGESDARVRELASSVRVTTAGGRVRSDGAMSMHREHWSTSFYLDVPRSVGLAVNTVNGSISVEELSGTIVMRGVNGGITLRSVGGDVKGSTKNGGVRIELTGPRWVGQGLDVETRNGGVRLTLPENYSAELETGTVNGRVEIDFPVLIHAGRQRRFTTTLGSGGPKIRAMTTNGSVIVRRS